MGLKILGRIYNLRGSKFRYESSKIIFLSRFSVHSALPFDSSGDGESVQCVCFLSS